MNAALLTAAGESRRMGRPKALLPWGGRTLFEHNLHELLAACDQVVAVLGAHAGEIRPLVPAGAHVVVNPDWHTGRVSSLLAGFSSLIPHPSTLMICGTDQPLAPGLPALLLQEHRRGGRKITLPTHGGRFGHPPVFDGSLLPELLAISEAKQGLREVLHRHQVHTVEVPFPSVLWNFNRPEEYENAYRQAHPE